MNQVQCQVHQIEPLTPFVHKVVLVPSHSVVFLPGQYLMLHLDGVDKRAFSIASPVGSEQLELHIGVGRADSYAGEAMAYLRSHQDVTISIPMGEAYWHPERHEPTILMAGGTGFSYVKSILISMTRHPRKEPLHLYWGVRKEADLYDVQLLTDLEKQYDWLTVNWVVEEPDAHWQGQTGQVHQAVLADFEDLSNYDMYMAGRFEMVGAARDAFLLKGLLRERMFSDAFAFID